MDDIRPSEIVVAAVTAMLNGDQSLARDLVMGRPLDGTVSPAELSMEAQVAAQAGLLTAIKLVCLLVEQIADEHGEQVDVVWRTLLEGHTIG